MVKIPEDDDVELIKPEPTVWSGRTTSYHHKRDDWQTQDISDEDEALRKVWFLDVQWTKCPVEVQDEVRKMWRDYELRNDYSMQKVDLDSLAEQGYWVIRQYLLECQPNLKRDEQVIVHWWW